MPDVHSGIEVEGDHLSVNPNTEFDALLAQAVEKGKAETPAEVEYRPRDPSMDSAAMVYRDVLASSESTRVADGLSVTEPRKAPEKPYVVDPAALAQGQAILAREAADKVELAGWRFGSRLESAESDADIVDALVALHGDAPDQFDEALVAMAKEVSGVDPAEESDPDLLDDFSSTLAELDKEVELAEAGRKLAQAARAADGLSKIVARDVAEGHKAGVNRFREELGLTAAQARARINDAQAFAAAGGIELGDFRDPEIFYGHLRAADAAAQETRAARTEHKLHQEILDQPLSVSDGLEVFTALGWRGLNDQDLGRPKLNEERLASRAIAKRTSTKELQSELLARSPASIADGLTGADGKPVSLDDASGSTERYEQEMKDARARSQGLLR